MSSLHLKSLKWCAPYTYDDMCLKAVWTRPLIKEDELNHRGAQSTANVPHHQKTTQNKTKKKQHLPEMIQKHILQGEVCLRCPTGLRPQIRPKKQKKDVLTGLGTLLCL